MTVQIPAGGWSDPTQHRVMKDIEIKVNAATTAIAGLVTDSGALQLVAVEQVWSESVLIEYASDKAYKLIPKAAHAWTLDSITTISTTGTCTVTLTIGGVALGGGANSASTTLSTVSHTSANVLPVDGVLVLTVSANAACEGLSVLLKGRRTFVAQ